ncbi:MAG: hypothetical protein P4N24_17230 [Acidobacteriota bacterium]|nr:hypothetical protein [Acidobacteriota bacterium]
MPLLTVLPLNREPIHNPIAKAASMSPTTTSIGLRFIAFHPPASGGPDKFNPAVYQNGGVNAGTLFKYSGEELFDLAWQESM